MSTQFDLIRMIHTLAGYSTRLCVPGGGSVRWGGIRATAAGLLLACAAAAGPIIVENHSFETFNPLTSSCSGTLCGFNSGPIPSWSGTNSFGSFRPGSNTIYFDSLPDGEVVAFTNNGRIEQIVAETVVVGLEYTLMVDIGHRKVTFPQTGAVALLIGNSPILASGAAAPLGGFSTYTATYTGLPGDAGKTIGIRLSSVTSQGIFDNVRLSSTGEGTQSVPEPGNLVLVGLGMAAVAASRRVRATRWSSQKEGGAQPKR